MRTGLAAGAGLEWGRRVGRPDDASRAGVGGRHAVVAVLVDVGRWSG
jgi:hypothetical protein